MGWLRLTSQEKQYWEKFKAGLRADIISVLDEQKIYHTEIKEVREDVLYLKVFLLDNSAFLEIRPDVLIIVKIYSPEGIFKFKSRVISWNWKEGFTRISKPVKIERFQYRQYYRLSKNLPVEYGIISDVSDVVLDSQGITKDISVGGMAMVGSKKISLNTTIKASIYLEEDTLIMVIARILNQEKLAVSDKFITRLQFLSINPDDIKKIEVFVSAHSRRKE